MEIGLVALQQLTNMLPTVLQMFLDLAPIGIAALGGIGQMLTAIAPAIGPLSNLLAVGINNLTPFLSLLGQLASTVMTALAPSMMQWYQAMTPIVQQLVSAFLPVLQTLGPVLAQTGSGVHGGDDSCCAAACPADDAVGAAVGAGVSGDAAAVAESDADGDRAIPMITDALVVVLPLLTACSGSRLTARTLSSRRWARRSTRWRRRSPGAGTRSRVSSKPPGT
jgi:hypothetical protein